MSRDDPPETAGPVASGPDGVAASVAAAVEEQGAATQEIVRNVAQAAAGTGAVTSNIAGVAAPCSSSVGNTALA